MVLIYNIGIVEYLLPFLLERIRNNHPNFGSAEVLRNREGNVPMPRFIKSLIYGKAYYQMTLVINTLRSVILAGCLFFFIPEDKKASGGYFCRL